MGLGMFNKPMIKVGGGIDNALLTGLVSAWEFNETSGTTLVDKTGSYNATNLNATINQAGLLDKSYLFNGTNARIRLSPLVFKLPTDYTISIWFKTSSISATQYLYDYTIRSSGISIRILTTGFFQYYHYAREWKGITSNVAVTVGSWQNIIVTRKRGGTAYAYLNNVQVGSIESPNLIQSYNGATYPYIGADRDDGGNFVGNIDQTAFWSRVLTSDERLALYNSGNGLAYSNW